MPTIVYQARYFSDGVAQLVPNTLVEEVNALLHQLHQQR
eukprot:COSAG02_NODE_56802_length_283_cov_1.396739_1_plen_38_part_10